MSGVPSNNTTDNTLIEVNWRSKILMIILTAAIITHYHASNMAAVF